jgi:hypothetical protein
MKTTRRNFISATSAIALTPAVSVGAELSTYQTVSQDVVKMFSPVIMFHPDEPFLPCTIEHILQGAVLRDTSPTRIEGQYTSRPALAAFKGRMWMVYSDANSSQLWVASSADGLAWDDAVTIDGQHSSVPALAAFKDKLWIAYSDANSSDIWVSSSEDGLTWGGTHKTLQNTSIPALAAFNGKLWMAYSDANSSDIWITSSADGDNWGAPHGIGQNTSVPALVAFNGRLWMIYRDDRADDFWVTSSANGNDWDDIHRMGQGSGTKPPSAAVPAVAAFKGQIWTAYTRKQQSDIVITSSTDGHAWTPPHPLGGNLQSTVPAMAVLNGKLCMTYTEPQSSQLWAAISDDGDHWTRPDVTSPTQHDMAAHYNDGYYVEINPSQYPGEGLTAPMYYAIQQTSSYTEITYLIVCAYNGHQTTNIDGVGYCILDNFARHPGDIERVTVRFDNSSMNVTHVTFESHGNPTTVPVNQVTLKDKHVFVYSSLNAHGTFNFKRDSDWVADKKHAIVEFGDAVGRCGEEGAKEKIWTPREYRRVGLDAAGNPVNDQLWAKFEGRIGGHVYNTLTGGRNFGGSGLSTTSWTIIKVAYEAADLIGKIPREMHFGDGPTGLGTRPYIRPLPSV